MDVCSACGAALPADARFCAACGAPVATKPDERERKLATVVFADLVGSTELGASQDPERTRLLLERFYEAMAAEVATAGGTVEKFAGDALMAAFGAPLALEDHAERALHAALAMQRRMHELFGDALRLRVGINTGDVVVGKPHEGSSFVTGDSVNVAARLEHAAEPGEILVGERTAAIARGAFEFSEPLTVEAKGKPEGVVCRRLVRPLSLMRPRGVGGLQRAFVGRDEELDALEAAYEEVSANAKPQLVTILGDAGVGKTRLLREFWELLGARSPQPLRRSGRCLSYGQGITYWPLAEVLKEHFGILDSDAPELVLERLGPRRMLGLTLGLDAAQDLHPLAARDRFQDAWVAFLEEVAAGSPTVMLIEDVHWAEEQLLDLLERLVRDTHGPVLFVATARPELLEERPGWGVRVPATLITLEPLSTADTGDMLERLLGDTAPAGLRDVVVARSEGNPFFVEELLGTLIDRQVLERENGSWRMSELPADFTVPDTVRGVVAARIDLLDPAEKQALQAASVIGRVFWAQPVYELVDEAEPDLRVLEERDFIRRRPGSSMVGDREYAIKHALTREVAYAGIPRAKRARLHAAFARWLERVFEGRDEDAPFLAHHYAEAARPEDVDFAWPGDADGYADVRDRALAWLRRAAELSLTRFEIEEALLLLDRALELAPTKVERSALWRLVGRANSLKIDGEAFWTAMQRSLEGSDRSTAGDVYSELAFQTTTRSAMWRRRPDRELVAGWIEQALELAEPESPARAKALVARALLDPVEFGQAAVEADELAERLDDVELRSGAWDALSRAASARGEHDRALHWARRRFDLVRRLSDPDHISLIYLFGLYACLENGRFDEARRVAHAHDDVTRRLSPHHRLHAVALFADLERLAGRWEGLRELTQRVETAVAANAATPCALNATALLSCAVASARRENEAEARRLEESAEALGMEGYDVLLEPLRVQLALARGDLALVERKLADLQPPDFRDVEGHMTRLDALVALGRRAEIEREAPALLKPETYVEPFALRALGFAREDDELLAQAIERFAAMGLEWHAEETRKRFAHA